MTINEKIGGLAGFATFLSGTAFGLEAGTSLLFNKDLYDVILPTLGILVISGTLVLASWIWHQMMES